MIVCHFSNNQIFLVKFDTKNGLSDSFPFQKCILWHTSQLKLISYGTLFFYFFKISGLTQAVRKSYNRSKILLNVSFICICLIAAAVEGRFEAMKSTLQRNMILVDFIRWGILAQDLIPIQQWNETLRALYTEFATSNDANAIREFMGDMKQLVSSIGLWKFSVQN